MSATATAEPKAPKTGRSKKVPAEQPQSENNGAGTAVDANTTSAVASEDDANTSARKCTTTEYTSDIDGLDQALADLVGVRRGMALLGVGLTKDEERLRNIIKKYAAENSELGAKAPTASVKETIRRIVEFRGMLEVGFEAEIAKAFTRFDDLRAEIAKEDASLLKAIESDLAALQQNLRVRLESDSDYEDIGEAYAAVDKLLVGVIDGIAEEKERKRFESKRSSIKSLLGEL